MRKHWSEVLESVGACQEAIDWARTQPSLRAAWKHGVRADWMLWALARAPEPDKRRLTLAACEIARKALHLPRLAIEAPSEAAWAAGNAAYAAAYAAAWAAASAAALAARAASDAAYAAVWTVDPAVTRAASAASDAAYTAAYKAAREAALKDYCVIVRRHFPEPPKLGGVQS